MGQKVWLITGCSTGIGKEIAIAALKSGDIVVITARKLEDIKKINDEYPEQSLAIELDITDKKAQINAVETTIKTFKRIDVLVNNAGYGYRGATEEAEEEEIKSLFETNFFGPVNLIKLVLPYMREQKSGMIVNISSSGAFEASVGSGFYAATKAALEQVSDSLRKEVEPIGIKTLIVEPGAMRTDFRDRSLKESKTILSAYEKTSGKRRKENLPSLHDQIGSPKLLGEELVSFLRQDEIPQRILYGSDAVKTAEKVYKSRLNEVLKWKNISVKTDFS